jgi:hypothetical protein
MGDCLLNDKKGTLAKTFRIQGNPKPKRVDLRTELLEKLCGANARCDRRLAVRNKLNDLTAKRYVDPFLNNSMNISCDASVDHQAKEVITINLALAPGNLDS